MIWDEIQRKFLLHNLCFNFWRKILFLKSHIFNFILSEIWIMITHHHIILSLQLCWLEFSLNKIGKGRIRALVSWYWVWKRHHFWGIIHRGLIKTRIVSLSQRCVMLGYRGLIELSNVLWLDSLMLLLDSGLSLYLLCCSLCWEVLCNSRPNDSCILIRRWAKRTHNSFSFLRR